MAKESVEAKREWLHNQLNGAIALIVLSVLFVALRCVGVGFVNWKQRRVKPMFWEDTLVLASLVGFLPLCACAIVNAQGYIAYYSTTNRVEQRHHVMTAYKASYGFSVAYPVACVLPKLSICCMYLALFQVQMHMRRIVYVTMVFLIANAVAWLVPTIMVCHPISGYWNPKPHQTTCLNYNIFGTWITLPHIVSDLVILSLPLPYLWKMQMKLTKKIGLMFTFLVASIGVISGCLRLAFYIHRTYFERPGTSETTRTMAVDMIVSYLEPGMYLIAACLPRLKALENELHNSISTLLDSLRSRRPSYRSGTSTPGFPPRGKSGIEEHPSVPRVSVNVARKDNVVFLGRDGEARTMML